MYSACPDAWMRVAISKNCSILLVQPRATNYLRVLSQPCAFRTTELSQLLIIAHHTDKATLRVIGRFGEGVGRGRPKAKAKQWLSKSKTRAKQMESQRKAIATQSKVKTKQQQSKSKAITKQMQSKSKSKTKQQ